MKTTEIIGMKKPVCASCFEYPENCIGCEWHTCSMCGEELSDSETYDYRGFIFCEKHHSEGVEKVENKRKEVMEIAVHSVKSQSGGEWQNGGYKTMKTDQGGKPIPTNIKEPQILKDYEDVVL